MTPYERLTKIIEEQAAYYGLSVPAFCRATREMAVIQEHVELQEVITD